MNAQIQEFLYSIKSEKTKSVYTYCIGYFSRFAKMELQDLLKIPIKEIEKIIIDYIIHMRESQLAYASIRMRISPIFTFLELNDVFLNKRKIVKFFGEEKKTVKDEAYTREDIQKMLSMATFRTKLMILVFSSTGIRREAFLELKLKHLTKIPVYNLYKITVYENSKEEYTTYCTPECAIVIDKFLAHREKSGESLTPNSYLFRNNFNPNNQLSVKNVRKVTGQDLTTILANLFENTGLRKIRHGAKYERHQKALFHAFRKYFTNKLIEAGVQSEHRFLLEGHALLGNDAAYVRISEKQLLQEYLKALNNLTINEEFILKKKVEELTEKQDQIEVMKFKHDKEMKAIRKEMESKLGKILAKIDIAKLK